VTCVRFAFRVHGRFILPENWLGLGDSICAGWLVEFQPFAVTARDFDPGDSRWLFGSADLMWRAF